MRSEGLGGLEDGVVRLAWVNVRPLEHRRWAFEVSIREGRTREVRRLCANPDDTAQTDHIQNVLRSADDEIRFPWWRLPRLHCFEVSHDLLYALINPAVG